jgi:hypothetical protein
MAVLLLSSAASIPVFSQKRMTPDVKASVIAAFNNQCLTDKFPKKRLRTEIRHALYKLKDEPSHPESDGKYAVPYDLNGDGVSEYFVQLKDTGIGDNVYWGVFSTKPVRFLGIIFAEHVYLRQRVATWAAVTISSHISSSDSNISTYSYRDGIYQKVAGDYEVSANRKDEPKFVGNVRYLCERQ